MQPSCPALHHTQSHPAVLCTRSADSEDNCWRDQLHSGVRGRLEAREAQCRTGLHSLEGFVRGELGARGQCIAAWLSQLWVWTQVSRLALFQVRPPPPPSSGQGVEFPWGMCLSSYPRARSSPP